MLVALFLWSVYYYRKVQDPVYLLHCHLILLVWEACHALVVPQAPAGKQAAVWVHQALGEL